MEIINLTANDVVLINGNEKQVIPSSGTAKCSVTSTVIDYRFGYPVCETRYGEITGVPEPELGKIFIVSSIVGQAMKNKKRNDIFVVKDIIRDKDGHIIGCRRLARV